MARNDCYSANSLYFCGVKSNRRHEVAAQCSVFRATNLVETTHPNVCGRSNTRKGSAYDTLTARIGVFYCHKVMCNKVNEPKDARLEVIESIQEYLNDFHSVNELYQRAAKAIACLMYLSSKMCKEEQKCISDMVQDYIDILDLLEPLEGKEGEV